MIGQRSTVSRGRVVAVVGTALLLLLAGCRLPNVQPYADATAQLRDAIEVTGDVTVARVKGDDEPFNPAEPPEPADPTYEAWQLWQLWQVRLAAADALVAYADALADITAAGKAAGDNARDLGTAIGEIAAGLPGVGAPSSEVVALAVKLGEVAIDVKAAQDLAQAVTRAQPGVEGIASVLVQDLQDLRICYQTAYRAYMRESFLGSNSTRGSEYLRLATYHTGLRARVDALRAELKAENYTNPENRDLIGEVREAEQLLAAAETSWAPYRDEFQALERERQRVEALFDQAEAATAAWLQTHRDLAEAIRINRRPNWRELLRVAGELHVLVDAVRAAEHPLTPSDIEL